MQMGDHYNCFSAQPFSETVGVGGYRCIDEEKRDVNERNHTRQCLKKRRRRRRGRKEGTKKREKKTIYLNPVNIQS